MNCSACCNIIIDTEEFLSCSISNCRKNYHTLCTGEKKLTLESRDRWVCPECQCAAKRGGDNSSTPVGVTKKPRDPYVTHRVKIPSIRPVDKIGDTTVLVNEISGLRQEMLSMREQFSLEIGSYDTKLSRSITIIEGYEVKLSQAVSTIASHETKIEKYAELIETLVGAISKYEERSTKINSTPLVSDTATQCTMLPAPATSLGQLEICQTSGHEITPPIVEANKSKRRARVREEVRVASASTLPPSSSDTAIATTRSAPSSGKRSTVPHRPSTSVVPCTAPAYDSTTGINDEDEGWERVDRRTRKGGQRRRTVVKGSGANDDELKTVERARKIHACFFTPETTADTIVSYMKRKKQCDNYYVEKLKLAHSYYASFCLTVPGSCFEFFMSAENWPTSTQVSEWFRASGGRAGAPHPRRFSAPRRQPHTCDTTAAADAATNPGTPRQATYAGVTRAASKISGPSTSTA